MSSLKLYIESLRVVTTRPKSRDPFNINNNNNLDDKQLVFDKATSKQQDSSNGVSIRYSNNNSYSLSKIKLPDNPWETFYSTHKEGFFKDRHYLDAEHETLSAKLTTTTTTTRSVIRILDFGCGVGNAILPLLDRTQARVEYLGLDISATAVELLQQKLSNDCFNQQHCTMVRQLDLVNCTDEEWNSIIQQFNNQTGNNGETKFDFCLMIFTVSAFHPMKMAESVGRACKELKPGVGRICFRDYMKGDLAAERFAPGQCLGRNLFARQDGTLSFFFTEAGLMSLFEEIGQMRVLWIKKIQRIVENRSSELKMFRVWVGAEIIRIL